MEYWQDLAEPGQLKTLSDPTDPRAPDDKDSAPESSPKPTPGPASEPASAPEAEHGPDSLAQVTADLALDDMAVPKSPPRKRYQLLEQEGQRFIICATSPNIVLRVERALIVMEKERKKHPEQTIFLDGVYDGPPFYDNKARQYSLDHHNGCVRAFTLATCEQSVVMLLQGLPLAEGEWKVYINDPDLDALLASWSLMNHVELLQDDGKLLRACMPLIRVEGVIDAHGKDMALLAAITEVAYAEEVRRIDRLLEAERALKSAGRWQSIDFVQYTLELLEAIDELLFPAGFLDELLEIEELGRIPLRNQKVAVLCRSGQGIYAVETALKTRLDKQLGLIVLDLGEGRFTLRQVDPFLDQDLTPLYKALNRKDERADKEGDNRWGGSSDIGGSPRKTGSALSGPQILDSVHKLHGRKKSWFGRLFKRKGK